MVIYLDEQFLLNGIVDYLLLLLAGRLVGVGFSRLRLALSAGVGAAYAVAALLPELGFLTAWPVKLAAGVGLTLLAYGGERRFFRLLAVFFGLSCGLGGGVLALSLLRGGAVMGQGILFAPLELRSLLLWSALSWWLLRTAFRGMGKHSPRELLRVQLRLGEKTVTLTALRDSGNTLTVPWDGSPALAAEWQALCPLCPGLTAEDVRNPVSGLARLERESRGWCLLPYRAVGTASGLLLALRVDEITLNNQKTRLRYVALSPTPISDGGGYEAVVGVE